MRDALERHTFARFSREIFHDFECLNRAISLPNATLTRPRDTLTSCALRNARSARQAILCMRGAPKSNKICDAFARFLARFRTRHSTNFGAKCSTDSAHSFSDVIVVTQLTQRTPAEFCVRGTQNSNKIRNAFPRFLASFCSNSNTILAQSRRQMQR